MQLSIEQLRIVEDALEYSSNALSDEFEQNKQSREQADIQRSVEIYGKIRRINRLLNELRRNIEPQTKFADNVLVLARSR